MDRNLEQYVKVYHNMISDKICDETVEQLKTADWVNHAYYNYRENARYDYDDSLSISYHKISTYDDVMQSFWDSLHKYIIDDFNFPWYQGWSGFSTVRYNKYAEGAVMRWHCDHIHDLFDGERKGIPTLSIVGLLNDDFEGGEFSMWDKDHIIPFTKGDVMVFPSNFLFPHGVKDVKKGTRFSCVSWAY